MLIREKGHISKKGPWAYIQEHVMAMAYDILCDAKVILKTRVLLPTMQISTAMMIMCMLKR